MEARKSAFLVLDHEYPFWAKLVQKIKIISLSWNFVPGLIQICRIEWWCSLFPFSTEDVPLVQIYSKKVTPIKDILIDDIQIKQDVLKYLVLFEYYLFKCVLLEALIYYSFRKY